jgi:hypothetical protein
MDQLTPGGFNREGILNSRITNLIQERGPLLVEELLPLLQTQFPEEKWTEEILKFRIRLHVGRNLLYMMEDGAYEYNPNAMQGIGMAFFYSNPYAEQQQKEYEAKQKQQQEQEQKTESQ